MKKRFLVGVILTVLGMGATGTHASKQTPQMQAEATQVLYPVPVQISEDGTLIFDPDKWDKTKGFTMIGIPIE